MRWPARKRDRWCADRWCTKPLRSRESPPVSRNCCGSGRETPRRRSSTDSRPWPGRLDILRGKRRSASRSNRYRCRWWKQKGAPPDRRSPSDLRSAARFASSAIGPLVDKALILHQPRGPAGAGIGGTDRAMAVRHGMRGIGNVAVEVARRMVALLAGRIEGKLAILAGNRACALVTPSRGGHASYFSHRSIRSQRSALPSAAGCPCPSASKRTRAPGFSRGNTGWCRCRTRSCPACFPSPVAHPPWFHGPTTR